MSTGKATVAVLLVLLGLWAVLARSASGGSGEPAPVVTARSDSPAVRIPSPLPAPATTTTMPAATTSTTGRSDPATTVATSATTSTTVSAGDVEALTALARAVAIAELTGVGRDQFPERWPADALATVGSPPLYDDVDILDVQLRPAPHDPEQIEAIVRWTTTELQYDEPPPLGLHFVATPQGWRPVD